MFAIDGPIVRMRAFSGVCRSIQRPGLAPAGTPPEPASSVRSTPGDPLPGRDEQRRGDRPPTTTGDEQPMAQRGGAPGRAGRQPRVPRVEDRVGGEQRDGGRSREEVLEALDRPELEERDRNGDPADQQLLAPGDRDGAGALSPAAATATSGPSHRLRHRSRGRSRSRGSAGAGAARRGSCRPSACAPASAATAGTARRSRRRRRPRGRARADRHLRRSPPGTRRPSRAGRARLLGQRGQPSAAPAA